MTTKEMIKHLERRDTQYGWTLSWHYAQAIIKTLQDHDTLIGIIDTCYLRVVKAYTMLRFGEMKESGK